ncbi:MAG: hypothetical protein EOM37_07705 [Proteobacteria bacterium]|nr:hypothetical protein [Alphaproteobacteria bacterium]NCC03915.1 hypothetical protein [Pseudomonadota bacterium]
MTKKKTATLKDLFKAPPDEKVRQIVRESLIRADQVLFLQTAFSFLATRAAGKVVSSGSFVAECDRQPKIYNCEALKECPYLAPFALMVVAGFFIRWTNEGKPVYLAFDEKGTQKLVYTNRHGDKAILRAPTHIMLCREYKGKLQPPSIKADVFAVSEAGLQCLMPRETLSELIQEGYVPTEPYMDRTSAAKAYRQMAAVTRPDPKKSPMQARLPGF